MVYSQKNVLQYIKENDVKFVKLFFTDILGQVKSVSIMPGELEHAFNSGISFDATSVRGFGEICGGDLFLSPDPSTLAVLPWRPQHGRVVRFFCSLKNPDGSPFAADSRRILRGVVDEAAHIGFSCNVGTECEFYLFEVDEKGCPSRFPQDNAGYCDLAPKDKGENIRREICLTLEQMGISPETSRHEVGPGQHEIVFSHSEPITALDNLTTFKLTVKTVAAKNGLFASFLPKPFADRSGSGLHVNLSLYHSGKNLFSLPSLPPEAECFIAGILNRVREITAFTNPLTNSYLRFGGWEAPKYLTWAPLDRSQLIRIPAAQDNYCRIELRSPDPSCNHYLAIALAIAAGIEGIKNQQPLQPAFQGNVYRAAPEMLAGAESLPETLEEAAALAEKSDFVKSVLSEETALSYLRAIKAAEEPEFGEI
jgi:glutamine synthetase